jgi:hypothetical protein
MSAQKPIYFLYQSKNSTTGLADVKAQVYFNGVAKAVAGSAIALTELDSTNAPGIYQLFISAALLTTWGVTAGQENALEVVINSASKPAEAFAKSELTVANFDDIDTHLTTQDTAIAAVKSDTAAIKTDLETGASSLSTILTAVQAIQNNAGFAAPVPATLIKPSSGSNSYRLPLNIYNEKNGLVDPDSNAIVTTLVNQAGADRSSYLTGASGGSAPAVRDSLGQYHIDLAVPSTAAQEELIFSFAYSISGAATARKTVTEIISDVQADGFALQTTLLDVQTRTTDVQTKVNDATYGLAAANTLQGLIKTQTDKIGDATIGLSAIKAAVVANGLEVTSNVEGSGFVSGTDSLHAISAYLQANLFQGGKAV